MDVRNSLDGLRTLLGVNPAAPSAPQSKSNTAPAAGSFLSDSATLSNAANEISQAAWGEGVRTEKVAAVQAALAAGTYAVPSSAVAAKVIDSMLGNGQ